MKYNCEDTNVSLYITELEARIERLEKLTNTPQNEEARTDEWWQIALDWQRIACDWQRIASDWQKTALEAKAIAECKHQALFAFYRTTQ